MTDSLWSLLALFLVKAVGRATFLTALAGVVAVLLHIGGPSA